MNPKTLNPGVIALIFVFLFHTIAQTQSCKELNLKAYDQWNDVRKPILSNDGNFLAFELNPQKGDGKLIVYNTQLNRFDTIQRGHSAAFLPDHPVLIYKIAPPYDSLRKQKLAGIKADKLMKDSLAIRWLNMDSSLFFPDVKNVAWSKKSGNLIAWLHDESYQPQKDTTVADSTEKVKKPGKSKQKKAPKSYHFGAYNIATSDLLQLDKVTDFVISNENNMLSINRIVGLNDDSCAVYKFNNILKDSLLIFNQAGNVVQLSADQLGNQLAFLHTSDTSSRKLHRLYYLSKNKSDAVIVADSNHVLFEEKYVPAEHFAPRFAKDGSALYFGIIRKPAPLFNDSLTAEEKTSLDLWHWKDGQLQTQQLFNLERERKRSHLTVFYPKANQLVRLESEEIPDVRADFISHPDYFLAMNPKPYEMLSSWEQARYQDVYLIDRKTGKAAMILEKHTSIATLSPGGKTLAYYSIADSSWYGIDTQSGSKVLLAHPKMDVFYQSENDIPRPAGPLGVAGWRNESQLVVYSQHNLWLLNIKQADKSMTLIKNDQLLRFRYLKLDEESTYLPDQIVLSLFNEKDKSAGFGTYNFSDDRFTIDTYGDFRFSGLAKSKHASTFIYRRENFLNYPDILFTNDLSKEPLRVSNANPQLQEYCMGSVELVDWMAFNGKTLQGLLYHPAGFSVDTSYPMLVYFYERSSDGLHRHITPRPSRSVINISEYTNRGYFVFVPDIVYTDGLPGQSAYDAIISGTNSILERYPQIDKKRLGLQGQSWGGYQTAWLITRTDMFAAAMAGAPVSNMTSAYGGIRWGSGVVRAFQYEEGQSRIGASLWEDLPKYIENSPLFYADRIQTPLLIMANDADGAVPWYQGIEFFTALRRLQKPAWMLNYNKGPHNLSRRADMEDLTRRMQQFFDHYLKNAPAPEWIKNGIPALDKGVKNGFQYE